MTNARLEALAWVLIYGGLLVVCLGLFMKPGDAVLGWSAIALGAASAVAGAVLIYLRSKR
jgi:hypothetical protein